MWKILLGEFLGDLQAQRTRAMLTFFAVAWGTLSVVLLLAFGEGLKRAVTGGLLAAGDRILMVGGGVTSRAWKGLPQGRRIALVEEDLGLLRRSSELDRGALRKMASPSGDRTAPTRHRGRSDHERCGGCSADGGRFINEQDIVLKRRCLSRRAAEPALRRTSAVGLGGDDRSVHRDRRARKKFRTRALTGPTKQAVIAFRAIYGGRNVATSSSL
jgi:hypothetical protein